MLLFGKIPVHHQFVKYSDHPTWQQCPIKSHLNHNSNDVFELQQVVLATSTCLNASSCYHMIGLDICINDQLNQYI